MGSLIPSPIDVKYKNQPTTIDVSSVAIFITQARNPRITIRHIAKITTNNTKRSSRIGQILKITSARGR